MNRYLLVRWRVRERTDVEGGEAVRETVASERRRKTCVGEERELRLTRIASLSVSSS